MRANVCLCLRLCAGIKEVSLHPTFAFAFIRVISLNSLTQSFLAPKVNILLSDTFSLARTQTYAHTNARTLQNPTYTVTEV